MTQTETKQRGGVKKGKASWKKANYLEIHAKAPNLRYRWVLDDPQEIRKRLHEGWSFVNPETGAPGERVYQGQAENPMEATPQVRELVAMALPEEIGKAHDDWVVEQTQKHTVDLVTSQSRQKFDAALGADAPMHGKTVIE